MNNSLVAQTKPLQYVKLKDPLPVTLKSNAVKIAKDEGGKQLPDKGILKNIVSACYVSQNEADPFD